MPDLIFILPSRNIDTLHRTLSMLSFQKDRSFRVCVVDHTGTADTSALVAEFEDRFPVTAVPAEAAGGPVWKLCLESAPAAEWVCFLRPDVDFTALSVKRMLRCIADHPAYSVFHWNLSEPARRYRLVTRPAKLFTRVVVDGGEAPLSSFVFRTQTLRALFADDSESAGMDLALIVAAAAKGRIVPASGKAGIRTARRERIGWTRPEPSTDPAQVGKDDRARLALFRWSERFFGDDYPLDTGDRLTLFAGELARLYPSYSPADLKEDLNTFAVVSGPIRRMRAAAALNAALKARQESLK